MPRGWSTRQTTACEINKVTNQTIIQLNTHAQNVKVRNIANYYYTKRIGTTLNKGHWGLNSKSNPRLLICLSSVYGPVPGWTLSTLLWTPSWWADVGWHLPDELIPLILVPYSQATSEHVDILIRLLGAGLRAQAPLEDIGPSCHHDGLFFFFFNWALF